MAATCRRATAAAPARSRGARSASARIRATPPVGTAAISPRRARAAFALAAIAACARPAARESPRPEVEELLGRLELSRAPSAESRALLASPEAPIRARAALAAGRAGDREAVGALAALLRDEEAGEMAAWALGRISGGREPLLRCLQSTCPAAIAAARALSGPEAFKDPAIDALTGALFGPAAREAAFSLGVLARNKEAKFPAATYAGLASALGRDDARAAAAYALSRLPRGDGVSAGLAAALHDVDGWTRSVAA